MSVDNDVLYRIGTALADGTRRRILTRLIDGPAYPAELAALLGTTRANVSNHLACLRGCGVVRCERQGRFISYRLAHVELVKALRVLATLPPTSSCPADLDGRS